MNSVYLPKQKDVSVDRSDHIPVDFYFPLELSVYIIIPKLTVHMDPNELTWRATFLNSSIDPSSSAKTVDIIKTIMMVSNISVM